MRSLEEPGASRGRRLLWILLGAAMLGGLVAWYATSRIAPPPDTTATPSVEAARADDPTSGNERPAATERPAPGAGKAPVRSPRAPRDADRAAPRKAPPVPPRARELRVSSDVPGAYVFLDRKFLGRTPLVARDVAPGQYQLNVQVEGRPPVVRTVEVVADTPTIVEVALPPAAKSAEAMAAVNATVAVVHQHGVGSCEGTLRADGNGLQYETAHKDAFSVPYANVETFTVDYAAKRLRLKQRGGRTWNFTTTAANADPLFVFHRDVEAARR